MSSPRMFPMGDGIRSIELWGNGSAVAIRSGIAPIAIALDNPEAIIAFAKAVLAQQAGREREALVEDLKGAKFDRDLAGAAFDDASMAVVEARKALIDFDDKVAG